MKKIPLRQCLGCREMKMKSQLLRVVKSPEGEIRFDLLGKMPGRGAYLCKEEVCFKKIVKTRSLERCFSKPISSGLYEEISLHITKQEVINFGKTSNTSSDRLG